MKTWKVTIKSNTDNFTDRFEVEVPDWYEDTDVAWSAQTEMERVYGVNDDLYVYEMVEV